MVLRDSFITKIRELKYTYKTDQLRTQLWRKKGGTHCMFVPRKDRLEDDFVKGNLRDAGLSNDEIRAFIESARVPDE